MIWLTAWEARKLLTAHGEVEFSPDLGISKAKAQVKDHTVELPDGESISVEDLRKIAKDETHAYFIKSGQIFKAVIVDNGRIYKLTPVPGGAPTHEISGIRMHRIKDTTPDQGVKKIFRYIHIDNKSSVLDVCTGLGYTAQEAAIRGAHVTTIELDENVLELSKINPWSREFWGFVDSGRIELLIGDAFGVIKNLPSNKFTTIIHDPPRFSMAGELYSLQFYTELFRVAKPGAQLFHYTGNPGERFRRKSVTKGVIERLRKVGWRRVVRVEEIQGVLGVKPFKQ